MFFRLDIRFPSLKELDDKINKAIADRSITEELVQGYEKISRMTHIAYILRNRSLEKYLNGPRHYTLDREYYEALIGTEEPVTMERVEKLYEHMSKIPHLSTVYVDRLIRPLDRYGLYGKPYTTRTAEENPFYKTDEDKVAETWSHPYNLIYRICKLRDWKIPNPTDAENYIRWMKKEVRKDEEKALREAEEAEKVRRENRWWRRLWRGFKWVLIP